jgi:hypothetical protein
VREVQVLASLFVERNHLVFFSLDHRALSKAFFIYFVTSETLITDENVVVVIKTDLL